MTDCRHLYVYYLKAGKSYRECPKCGSLWISVLLFWWRKQDILKPAA